MTREAESASVTKQIRGALVSLYWSQSFLSVLHLLPIIKQNFWKHHPTQCLKSLENLTSPPRDFFIPYKAKTRKSTFWKRRERERLAGKYEKIRENMNLNNVYFSRNGQIKKALSFKVLCNFCK